jgi:hypothetical protein
MRFRILSPLVAASLALAVPAVAQVKCAEGLADIDHDGQTRMTAQEFVREVAASEVAMQRALGNFGYTVDATVQTLDGENVDGEYRLVSTLSFDAAGPRREVTESSNTLKRIKFSDRDVDALRDAFILTPDRVAAGDIVYSGRQRMEPHNATLFDIMPRDSAVDVRGFQGRVWVRARQDAVMRSCGRSSNAPIAPMRVLVVRALVGEQHWFPVLIRADEDAVIGKETVRVRVTIKYSDYKAR